MYIYIMYIYIMYIYILQCGAVISWFINPLSIDISTISPTSWSYVHQVSDSELVHHQVDSILI